MAANLSRHLPDLSNPFAFVSATAVSEATLKSYTNGLKQCSTWLTQKGYSDNLPMPPSVLQKWLQEMTMEGLKPNTIQQRFWAIGWLHFVAGYEDNSNPVYAPELRRYKRAIYRVRANNGLSNKPHQKAPLRTEDIKTIIRHCPKTPIGLRDKALLLVGFVTALRRSELVSLKWSDIDIQGKTAVVHIRKSKTDQTAKGQTVTIMASNRVKSCPLKALENWGQQSGTCTGYVFPSNRGNSHIQPQMVATIIKKCCEAAGYDPDNFSGHSLRRGMLISAIERGSDLNDLKVHARHHDTTITEHYIGTAHNRSHNVTKNLF